MDSLTQLTLGAAVGLAAMGRRTAPWKAALWGGIAGTLPDLDVFIDHGDPILNMVLHRAETHAPFWQTLFSLPFAAAVARLHGQWDRWRRWWWALWLALVTHPLLDGMTVYGTRLGLPFTDRPFGVGSVFIIDPLYTLPLIAGVAWALAGRNSGRAWAANVVTLGLGTAYLAWGVLAQAEVASVARQSLIAQGLQAERMLVTPTAFNSVLWRVVVIEADSAPGAPAPTYLEGFRSLLDEGRTMTFARFDRGTRLATELQGLPGVRRIQAFSRGFWALWERDGRVGIVDLRMGQEPDYTFRFALAERQSAAAPLAVAQLVGSRPDLRQGLAWLWRRAFDESVPPPR